MLGEYVISPTAGATFAADDAATIGVGIGVVSTDAATAGAASVPDPIGEPDYPWLYWADIPFYFAGSGPGGDEITAHVRRQFDIRSMRKLKPRETLTWVFQYGNLVGNPPLSLNVANTRVLVAT